MRFEIYKNKSYCNEFGGGLREEYLVQKRAKRGDLEGEWKALKDALLKCAKFKCGMKKLSDKSIRMGSEWWSG